MLIKKQGSHTQNLKRFILFYLSKGLDTSFFLICLFIKVRMLIKNQGIDTHNLKDFFHFLYQKVFTLVFF